jgi:hypothetical protein
VAPNCDTISDPVEVLEYLDADRVSRDEFHNTGNELANAAVEDQHPHDQVGRGDTPSPNAVQGKYEDTCVP